MTRKTLLEEFADSPPEVHAIATGGSFGALTAFVWTQHGAEAGLLLGLTFLSSVTGIRLRSALRASAETQTEVKTTKLIQQLRDEGHYTATSFVIAAIIVYGALL